MVETFITTTIEEIELSELQINKIRYYIDDAPLTIGSIIEIIYLIDPKAEVRIRHYPDFNEYKVCGIMKGHPVSRVGSQLHRVLFDILKALL